MIVHRRIKRLLSWQVALAFLVVCRVAVGDEPSLVVSIHDEGATVFEGATPVLSYQANSKSLEGKWERADYVHPLYDLQGQVITEDFPEDHRHHRGIFWAWHQVWVGQQMLGDPWVCQEFQWDVQSVTATTPGNPVVITAVTHWKSPALLDANGNSIAVVEETARVVTHAAQADRRVIDFDISLVALVDGVRIGGSQDEKGYGGFSPRLRMVGDEQIISSAGILEPSLLAITQGTWVNITRESGGTLIIVHRENPEVTDAGVPWILRRTRSMQNVAFPGREPVAISMSEPTRIRYRMVIHDGSLDAQSIEAMQGEFWESGR